MPNYQDDPQQQGQLPTPGSAGQRTNIPPHQNMIRQSSGAPIPEVPFSSQRPSQATPSRRQSRQDPIVLRNQQETGRNEPQRQGGAPIPPVRYAPQNAWNVGGASQESANHLEITDYIMIGLVCFLFLAIVTFLVYILRQFLLVKRIEFNATSTWTLLALFVIYAGCVAAGFLWGRYQSKTVAHKENEQLRDYTEQLRNYTDRLKAEIAVLRAQNKPLQPVPSNVPYPPAVDVVVQPKPIDPIAPARSIYDTVREPDDPSDLVDHPHEKIFPAKGEKNSLRYGWHIIGASRRGYGHAYDGKYREDDFNIKLLRYSSWNLNQDIVLVAIADGVSSKAFSRHGARAAVLGATSTPELEFQNLAALLEKNAQYPQCRDAVYHLLMNALGAARETVEQRAQQDGVSVDELQSTLMVFLAAPFGKQRLFVASMQVGDGALFALQENRELAPRDKWRWLQQPQIQGAGNEVQPFMRTGPEIWRNSFQSDLLEQATLIMGMTDGTADDIEPPRATPENPKPDQFLMVDDFYQRIALPSFHEAQPGEVFVKLLGYRKKQSFDDRTVVCLYR